MTTPNSSADLVTLPRLTVPELLSLMEQLLIERLSLEKKLDSEGKRLPDALLKSSGKVEEARLSLQADYQVIVPSAPDKKGSDRVMDNAWRATEAFVRGVTLLQTHHSPGPKEAAEIYKLWFYDGLRFINFIPEVEYQETQKRLEAIKTKNLVDTFKSIGGGPFLSDLETSFVAYGQALQITSPRQAPTPILRPSWEKAQDMIRLYVTKVVGLEDPDEPETLEQIKALLAPLKEWETKTKAERSAEPPTPEQPLTPEQPPSTEKDQ